MSIYNVLNGVGTPPVWVTAAGSLGSAYDIERSSFVPTVPSVLSSSTTEYTISAGALPSGMSLGLTTGAITGTPNAVGSDTTSTFTIKARNPYGSAEQTFTITIRAPVSVVFTSTAAIQTWTKPSDLTKAAVHAWGGGGGAGNPTGLNTGGAGGYVYGVMNILSVSSLYVAVGSGGFSNANYRTDSNGNGCGGGLSGIFTVWDTGSLANTHAGAVIVAGAGGSGGNTGNTGGCGGGLEGGSYQTGAPNFGGNGRGGTQSGPGIWTGSTGGACTITTCSGERLTGGPGCGGGNVSGKGAWPNEIWIPFGGTGGGGNGCNAGAGGGGYYGGAGGGSQQTNASSGGGGSSYYGGNATVPVSNGATEITTQLGSSTTPPQTGNAYYAAGVAVGGLDNVTNGGPGRVVIVY